MPRSVPPRVKKFPAAKQRPLDELLQKNREGTIGPMEKGRLEKLVDEAEQLMVDNAQRIAAFAAGDRDAPTDAQQALKGTQQTAQGNVAARIPKPPAVPKGPNYQSPGQVNPEHRED